MTQAAKPALFLGWLFGSILVLPLILASLRVPMSISFAIGSIAMFGPLLVMVPKASEVESRYVSRPVAAIISGAMTVALAVVCVFATDAPAKWSSGTCALFLLVHSVTLIVRHRAEQRSPR